MNKSIVKRVVALLLLGAFASAFAFAKTTKKEVTIVDPVTVNGTLVKKGTYNVIFDDETGELTIKKGGKVLVTAQARLEKTNDRRTGYTRSATNDPIKPAALVSVFFSDGQQATILDKGENTATSTRP